MLFDIYEQLQIWLESQPPSFYVLLIDDYDAPWSEHWEDPEVSRKIRRILTPFYATVKTTEGSLRFLFMTGVTKFRQSGVFSALNITEDLSLSANVATLLGFTEAEIRASFGGYLQRAARVLSSGPKQWTVDDVMVEMHRHCGGYCFDRTLQEYVYNPGTVVKFLEAPEAGFNHDRSSGDLTTGLVQFVQTSGLTHSDAFQGEKRLPQALLEGLTTEEAISGVLLLTQMGYLTLKRREAGDFYVDCPNEAAERALTALSGDGGRR